MYRIPLCSQVSYNSLKSKYIIEMFADLCYNPNGKIRIYQSAQEEQLRELLLPL